MGFDEETLEPTYVLRLGAPGKSAGLDIARRHGLPAEILDRARATLGTRERDLGRFLAELDRRLTEVAASQRALEEERQRLQTREKALAEEWAKKESAKLKEIERQTELVLERFEAQAQEAIGKVSLTVDQKRASAQAQRNVSKVKRELREEMQTAILSTQSDSRAGELAPLKIAEGARVRLKNIREPARVRRLIGADRLEVEAGFMKMQISRDEVLEVLPAASGGGTKLPQGVSFKPSGPDVYVSAQEVNVIGKRAEEARDLVDKFLDSAVMASANRVRIVHGHGMGILRRMIAELLAENPNVEKFYPAPQNEGGAGATIVELKE
jgi:DNA mismatch repair protein MutS2